MKYLSYIDQLADEEAPIHRINIDGATKYKSSLGGFCTLTLIIIFLLVLLREGQDVVNGSYPFVSQRPV